MADKQIAQNLPDGNFGSYGMIGSDGSQEAENAWLSVLTGDDGEEHAEGDAASESSDDESMEAEEDNPDVEEEDDESESEDEGDEDDEEDDEDDSDEDDDKSEPKELDPETKVKVKVNGEESEVTLKELRDGYSRTQDYTRKTQQAAQERRELEAQREEVLQQRQQWSQLLENLKPRVEAQLSGRSEEDWAKLKAEDELTYYEERDKERATQQRIQAIKQEQAQVQQDLQARQQKQLQDWARQETETLLSKIPDWAADQELAKKEVQQMREYGTEVGFSEQEIGNIIDHRALLVMRDAAKYRALQKAKESGKAKVTKKQRTLKPGSPSTVPPSKVKSRKAKQRLAKTNTVEAAAGVFEQFLND